MMYDLPWVTIILTFCYLIHIFNTKNPQNGVGKRSNLGQSVSVALDGQFQNPA